MSARRKLTIAALVLGVFLLSGLFNTGYRWFDTVAHDEPGNWRVTLLEELTGTLSTFVLLLPIAFFTLRFPFTRRNWGRMLGLHLLIVPVYSVLHTSMMAGSRAALSPALGLGEYDYGHMPTRYLMEGFNDAFDYARLVALIALIGYYVTARRRELDRARLETELQRAQLDKLRAQLDPHFLFNTLNAISARMYQDPSDADRMLGRLAELLRISLRDRDHLIAVRTELESVELFLEIMRLRFPDRLTAETRVDDAALGLEIPSMLVQPLLENALEHAAASRREACSITVSISVVGNDGEAGRLRVEVLDDGPGPPEDPIPGVGLTSVTERLRFLYRDRASLRIEARESGGCRAVVELPAGASAESFEPRPAEDAS